MFLFSDIYKWLALRAVHFIAEISLSVMFGFYVQASGRRCVRVYGERNRQTERKGERERMWRERECVCLTLSLLWRGTGGNQYLSRTGGGKK